MSCFGHLFQRRSSSKGTGTSLSLVIFRNSTVFNHMLFLVMFPTASSLFTWSKLLSHLSIPSALDVRNVSLPALSLYPLFLPPFCHVALWDMQGSTFVHGFQWIFLLGGQFSPPLCCWPSCLSAMGLTSGQEWHSVPQTSILLCAAWLFKLSLGLCLKRLGALRVSGKLFSGVSI